MFLRQSTASQEVLLGPFLDDTDGKTAETALSIANTDIKIWKNGGTAEASKNSGGATHIASGRYYAVLDATDTDTVGLLEVNVHVSGALPVRRLFYVLEEAVYDALFAASAAGYQVPIWAAASSTVNLSGTTIKTATDVETDTADIQSRIPAALVGGRIDANVGAISADSVAADNAEAFFDGTGYAGTGNVIPTVTTLTNAPSDSSGTTTLLSRLTSTRAGYLDNLSGGAVALASGVNVVQISGDSIAADNLEAMLDGTGGVTITAAITGNVTGNLSGSVGSVTGNVGGNVVGSVGSISGVTFPANFASLAITAGGVVDADLETIKGQTVTCAAGVTIGVYVGGTAAAATATALSSLDTKIGTPVDLGLGATIAAGIAELHNDTTLITSSVSSLPSAATTASAVRTELTTELARIDVAVSTRLASGSYTAPLDAAGVRTAVGLASANLDTQLAAIVGDTNELQTDWANGGRLDLIIDAIAANVVLVLADTGTDGVVLSAATCNKIADHVRRRTQANVEASSDGDALSLLSEYGFIQMAQESAASGTTLTVYRTDGTTSLGTRTLATDAAADPVTGVS